MEQKLIQKQYMATNRFFMHTCSICIKKGWFKCSSIFAWSWSSYWWKGEEQNYLIKLVTRFYWSCFAIAFLI